MKIGDVATTCSLSVHGALHALLKKRGKRRETKRKGKRYLHLFVFSHDHSIIDKIHESYRAEGRRGAAGLWDSAVY